MHLKRTFADELMVQWFELVDMVRLTPFREEEDSLIWQHESNGVYSSKSLYAIVHFKGVQSLYLHAV